MESGNSGMDHALRVDEHVAATLKATFKDGNQLQPAPC